MTHTVLVNWVQGLAFDGFVDNHRVRLDALPPQGLSQGPSPKKLLLTSLISCTAMDVVSLLEKMRIPFDKFQVEADADLTESIPKVYSEIRLTYRFWGVSKKYDKVEKAIKLSKENFCGVSIMLQKACPILYSIEFLD